MFDPKDNPPLDDFKPVTLITDGDQMTVADYLACVECGGFIDYDGFGHPATSTHEDERFTIIPSLGKDCIPPDATPGCPGTVKSAPGGGIKCDTCNGWFCF